MERFKAKTKFLQYQLWQECNNGCPFCSERNQFKIDKAWALRFTLEKLDLPETKDYEEVGIIGGEIFDNQLENDEVRDLFYQVTDKIASMHFSKFYVATNLIYNMDNYLIPYLYHLRELGIMDKVLLCTSYDIKYRFHTEESRKLWEDNMLRLLHEFPDLKTHVETIMTQHFIDAVLNKEFSISDFCKKFRTRIDYIEPSSGMFYNTKADCEKACPGFFPTKASFIKFLKFAGLQNKEIDLKCLISYQIRANRIYHLDCGKYVCYEDRRQPGFRVKCSDESKKYELGFIDSDESMEDICNEFCKLVSDEYYV